MKNRQRVSSHDLYQSISVLRDDGLEKDVFQGHWRDVDRHGVERPSFVHYALGPRAREQREHTALPADTLDARRTERRLRRVAIEHQLNAAVPLAEIVERAGENGTAAIDDRDV